MANPMPADVQPKQASLGSPRRQRRRGQSSTNFHPSRESGSTPSAQIQRRRGSKRGSSTRPQRRGRLRRPRRSGQSTSTRVAREGVEELTAMQGGGRQNNIRLAQLES
ncbi:hypothetical protein E2562_014656 [Oryza meyeriana var. granulata]|uniref:Uncharacterized protein n=1 Tax=Oryza meyeriana var. granulata TaxID=110450 RepID=A0A6G1D3R2_9ORYZ|nr:hypothetical protein E2562_014656 [Oryza meyeriana var. granulata]